jgi:hypothetical protein
MVNRNAAVIKPRQPLLAWVKMLPNQDLIPEFPSIDEAINYIESIYEELFDLELASWYQDEALWPGDRDLKLFREWFDVEIHSEVFDVLDEAVEKELL